MDIKYLFILLIVPALTFSDSEPSYGVNMPHGSITFYGPNFGDNRSRQVSSVQTQTMIASTQEKLWVGCSITAGNTDTENGLSENTI